MNRHEIRYGLLTALVSVVLISAAQLFMKWGMSHDLWSALLYRQAWLTRLIADWVPVLAVMTGLACYALSMLCWIITLKRLPLSLAYPLLSLSYVLVYLCSLFIPVFEEYFSLSKLLGIGLIICGLLVIFKGRPHHSSS